MADDHAKFEDEEVEYEEVYEEVEVEVDADTDHDEDADFHDDDDDDDAFDDDDGAWDDDDLDVNADQQYIPIEKTKPPDDEEEEYMLDKDGNIISPSGGHKRNKSVDIQCWTCSNCKAINKLSWTLTKFAMKCCMCKQDTYTPAVKIFVSDIWEEPSNDFWECTRCTLHNPIGSNECQACQAMKVESAEQVSDDDEERGAGESSEMFNMGGPMGLRGMGGGDQRRREPRDTQPFDKKKECNLRNLLVIGFIRKVEVTQLPTKFFDVFNYYYSFTFDRWDYGFLRGYWTTKKNDLVTLKRSKKDKGKWKNMFSLKQIKMNPKEHKFPTKYRWTLRVLDRLQIESEGEQQKKKVDEEQATSTGYREIKSKEEAKKKKEEEFEMQYIDVLIGVVNVEKISNTEMQNAFNQYSCGYAVFAGNGKVFTTNQDWVKVFKPIKHGETVSVNLEWMSKQQYRMLYATEKERQQAQQKNDSDDWCVALTFDKNDDHQRTYPKGAAIMLQWSSPYKLALSSAEKRWEIEWISANWISQLDTPPSEVAGNLDDDQEDNIK